MDAKVFYVAGTIFFGVALSYFFWGNNPSGTLLWTMISLILFTSAGGAYVWRDRDGDR